MMLKKVMSLFIPICVYGCSSNIQPSSPVKNSIEVIQFSEEYGDVSSNHPAYVKASRECESETFGRGILVNGDLLTDRDELLSIWSKHRFEYIKKRMEEERDIIEPASVASTSVNIKNNQARESFNEYVSHLDEYANSKSLPESIKKIEDVNRKYIACLRNEKGFRPVRVLVKNPKTGDVVSVHETP
ncbi:hypothetical protein KO507_06955 [Gilvimarinus agarilyticus]|uniref:hypothetical protein n=1 Tax=Gilvimarinus sp. 2_MG-2023 TaxID=3062666 RepID=UPI001C090966|nr:hypothetical protein [Gilvimarinus sp. 2_MG-2023]MBU2885496.1 hypothetical protein [Gilvimarinus agarilyticus]MDO6570396.1 hypothetical protein [Gilvimarinus sp. 2_MG-2023]